MFPAFALETAIENTVRPSLRSWARLGLISLLLGIMLVADVAWRQGDATFGFFIWLIVIAPAMLWTWFHEREKQNLGHQR